MKQTENEAWWFLMGVWIGLIFSPWAATVYWNIGGGILMVWVLLRDMIIWDYDEQVKK